MKRTNNILLWSPLARNTVYLLVFFWASISYAASTCSIGTDASASLSGDVASQVYDASSTTVPYAGVAPHRFNMIVFHDPGSNNCDPRAMIMYGQTYDTKRDGYFGYHFYVARDGTIYEGAPLSKRTNHVSGSSRRTPLRYDNSMAIGISLMCGHEKIPRAQLDAAVRLGHILQVAYGIPSNRIFGHGELQYNRLPNEGLIAARATRTTPAVSQSVVVFDKKKEHAVCRVAGAVPDVCTDSTCEVFSRVDQETIEGLPPGLYRILQDNTGYELPSSSIAKMKIPLPPTKYSHALKTIPGSTMLTDAQAWGYGEAKSSAASKTHQLIFTDPLNGLLKQ